MEWFNLEAEELVDVFLTSDDADALVLLQHSIEVSLSRAYELEPTPAGLFATIKHDACKTDLLPHCNLSLP